MFVRSMPDKDKFESRHPLDPPQSQKQSPESILVEGNVCYCVLMRSSIQVEGGI